MSAPKPKVEKFLGAYWHWLCECGRTAYWICGSQSDALRGAFEHSRTHAAERIADQLDRDALARRADGSLAIDAAGNVTDYSVYQQGVAKGLEHAERLVREHLVPSRTP